MTTENLKQEFEIRKLKAANKQLMNTNTLINRQYKNLNEHFDRRVQEEVNAKVTLITNETKEELILEKRRADIAESLQQRLEKKLEKEQLKNNEKDNEIKVLKEKIIEMAKQLKLTELERDSYLAKLNINGETAGIPTSQTPINKKKKIPNTRETTDKTIGGQKGHKKNKLEKFREEEINEIEEVILEECPHCHSKELKELDSNITKDELDYEIKIIKKRYSFKEYECLYCKTKVRQNIPKHLKEENQYGSKVQATALTLANIGNVPMNKIRKIISGLTLSEIELSEGYIAKLQKRAANKLDIFISDLKLYITHLTLVYWDDTVVMINTSRGCMRFYGNKEVALYCAHEHKDKAGLDKDNILGLLTNKTIVEHDHNKVNYNEKYSFKNAECCQHLIRDLEKVTTNIPSRTWSKKMKELFQEFDHKRNELIKKEIDHFEEDELNDFVIKVNEYLLLGLDENSNDEQVYYAGDEKTLINRIMEYRDNYIYWIYDFDLPFTNNLSERALRGIKSKMKSAGQFQNVSNAEYYATIRSYIETCYRNNINGHEALVRLLEDNPYTLHEILEIGKQTKKSN